MRQIKYINKKIKRYLTSIELYNHKTGKPQILNDEDLKHYKNFKKLKKKAIYKYFNDDYRFKIIESVNHLYKKGFFSKEKYDEFRRKF